MSRTTDNRVYHQDYIARIRYSNALPPPPNPPKLLNIPGTGLANGYYTSASFASRMAREQPLNIEADAELGMPINLVGLPGVFDGDESSISGLDYPPPAHPHDKPLLRSVAALGKPIASNTGVSFLRRTEYISSDAGRTRFESTTSKDLVKPKADARKRKRPDVERIDDPARIRKAVLKGFDIAYPQDADITSENATNKGPGAITPEERKQWNTPVHPTNPSLKLLDAYPLLPDPAATTDTGCYLLTKFNTNPVAIKTDQSYDQRLDVGILRPIENLDEESRRQALMAAHEADPKNVPKPEKPFYEYDFFLPANRDDTYVNSTWDWVDENDDGEGDNDDTNDVANRVRRRLDVNDPRRDDDDLYHAEKTDDPDSQQRYFVYKRLRRYETFRQVSNDDEPFSDVVAVALHDADNSVELDRLQKAAYFYPILQRSNIRGKRTGAGGMGASQMPEQLDDVIDYLNVVVRDPDESEAMARGNTRENMYFQGEGEEDEEFTTKDDVRHSKSMSRGGDTSNGDEATGSANGVAAAA